MGAQLTAHPAAQFWSEAAGKVANNRPEQEIQGKKPSRNLDGARNLEDYAWEDGMSVRLYAPAALLTANSGRSDLTT